jgi:hypothetical protein
MTDRINGFTVVLEKDLRDDDFEQLQQAVLMLKGVSSIVPNIVNSGDTISRIQAMSDIRTKLYSFIVEELK